ncbi:fimbrial protein [Ralstonia sp. 25C]|uniref:fimbrial protein n=1 Tax=Ralstonia sp. 25C TaxID=3447363 RepID=UPI003F7565F1
MKRILTVLLALGTLAVSQHTLAACRQMSKADIDASLIDNPAAAAVKLQSYQLTLPSAVEISPDLAIGGTIASGTSNLQSGTVRFGVCEQAVGGTMTWHMANRNEVKSPVYQTGVDGVGLQLTYVRPSGTTSDFEFDTTFPGNPSGLGYMELREGAHFKATLIKTGDIANNVNVLGGVVGSGIAQDGNTVIQVSSNFVNIKILPRCTVNSSNINIDFGTFGPRNVTATSGPSRPVNFRLACTGDNIPTKVTATLSGTPDPVNASLIKNDGTAQHLAIQLADVSTGTVFSPNNPVSKLEQTLVDDGSEFALTTQVLRVGTATPTAGTISSIATITLNLE